MQTSYLDFGFADLKSLCQFLTGECIRVARFIEGFLQFIYLFSGELGSVPSLVQSDLNIAAAGAAAYAVGTCWCRQIA